MTIRTVSRAVREGETWKLRLSCGHNVEARASRLRHASKTDQADAAFEPPPSRQRCAECERERGSVPSLF